MTTIEALSRRKKVLKQELELVDKQLAVEVERALVPPEVIARPGDTVQEHPDEKYPTRFVISAATFRRITGKSPRPDSVPIGYVGSSSVNDMGLNVPFYKNGQQITKFLDDV